MRAPPGFDVVHAVSLATLEPGAAPLVVTVHDLLWRRIPDAYPARGRRWHEAALRRALRRADRFIVPADVVASDLVEAGASREAITVIPMGSDHMPPPDVPAARAHLAGLGIHGPFLLCVGTLEPRKNLPRPHRGVRGDPEPAAGAVAAGHGRTVGLGGAGDHRRRGGARPDPCPPPSWPASTPPARLLAYVPLIEGFGLPPVEAMAVGTPVVASPLPSTDGAALRGGSPRHRLHRRRVVVGGHRRADPPGPGGPGVGPGRRHCRGRRSPGCTWRSGTRWADRVRGPVEPRTDSRTDPRPVAGGARRQCGARSSGRGRPLHPAAGDPAVGPTRHRARALQPECRP